MATPVRIVSDDSLFAGVESGFEAGRYHSWIVSRTHFPQDTLCITAEDEQGQIMALAHRKYDVRGVQFHPESVLTPQGVKLVSNWLKM